MMRSIIIFTSVLILAAMGFTVYWMVQEQEGILAPRAPKKYIPSAAAPTTTTNPNVIGPMEGTWIERYDKQRRLMSRIRSERYEPEKDGVWQVHKPQAEFFLHNDRVLRIVGDSGRITMQETVSRTRNVPGASALAQSPRMGELHNVVITMHPALDQPPTLTMYMACASFDNETFRIATEPYVENGRTVPWDQVPVRVRGADYEFDGRGLRLQYNEVDRRLENMRIEHGQRLLIKNANRFLNSPAPAAQPAPRGQGRAPLMFDAPELGAAMGQDLFDRTAHGLRAPLPVLLAAADMSAIGAAAVAAPAPPAEGRRRPAAQRQPTTRPRPEEPVYRATFKTGVVIMQGGRQLATAEDMQIDFLTEEGEDTVTSAAAAQPTSQPARPRRGEPAGAPASPTSARPTAPTVSAPAASPAVTPAPAPVAGPSALPMPTIQLPNAQPAPRAGRPTTAPAKEPIEVRWRGPLLVAALPGEPPDRIAPGESIVRLIGSAARPVRITREANQMNSSLTCANLVYWTIDGGAFLEEGPGLPVEMTDARGTHIITRSMVVSREEGTAQLAGKSHAKLPLPEGSKELVAKFMNVNWTERCTLYFEGADPDNMLISRTYLMGGVEVDHPQMNARADAMDLHFENSQEPAARTGATTQPAKSPQIRQVDAKGNVHCVVNGPAGDADKRRIDCQSLTLMTAHAPNGELYARNMVAIEQVHLDDSKRSLDAGYVSAAFAQPTTRPSTRPTTQPAGEALAAGAVPATQPAAKRNFNAGDLQSMIAHDNVRVKMAEGSTAQCDEMTVETKAEQTQITVRGRPAILQHKSEKLVGDLISMIPETEEMMVFGPGSLTGQQRASGDKPARPFTVTWTQRLEGHGDTIECAGNVVADTVDAEGARNTAKGQRITLVTAPAPTTRPTTRPSDDLDIMGNREVRSIVLEGNANVDSVLADAKGEIQRLMHLTSQTVQYFQPDQKHRRLVIPTAGKMLMVDNRPPGKDEAARQAAADPMSMGGKAAFSWEKSLTYDEGTGQLEMLGNVIARRINASDTIDMTLTGDRIIGDVEPMDGPATNPAGAKPTPRSGGGMDLNVKLELKQVRAEGNVMVVGKDMNLVAESISYNPAKHRLLARGTPFKRVRFEQGSKIAEFDEVEFDTQTWDVLRSVKPQFDSRK